MTWKYLFIEFNEGQLSRIQNTVTGTVTSKRSFELWQIS